MPKYTSRFSAQHLFLHGPVLKAEITIPDSVAKLRGSNPVARTVALIDTGATRTAISYEIANTLKLRPIKQVTMLGVSGPYKTNMYVVNFTFPGSSIVMRDIEVAGANLSKQPCGMLLGRDVLSATNFKYDGPTGTFEWEVPSPSIKQLEHEVPAQALDSPEVNRAARRRANLKKRKMEKRSRRKNR